MSEANAVGRNLGGHEKEIDEYLHGTILEMVPDEEDLDDIEAPEDDDFEVHIKAEVEEVEDEYVGKMQ
ncbi:MAG TPA: hypothetical protein VEA58_04885 [Anaerovoracaceae bacterium]|nr:hypothetical protein [Anaerovoracaceae bacterium]